MGKPDNDDYNYYYVVISSVSTAKDWQQCLPATECSPDKPPKFRDIANSIILVGSGNTLPLPTGYEILTPGQVLAQVDNNWRWSTKVGNQNYLACGEPTADACFVLAATAGYLVLPLTQDGEVDNLRLRREELAHLLQKIVESRHHPDAPPICWKDEGPAGAILKAWHLGWQEDRNPADSPENRWAEAHGFLLKLIDTTNLRRLRNSLYRKIVLHDVKKTLWRVPLWKLIRH